MSKKSCTFASKFCVFACEYAHIICHAHIVGLKAVIIEKRIFFKNIIYPVVGKEQTAKGGVLYEGRMFSRWL